MLLQSVILRVQSGKIWELLSSPEDNNKTKISKCGSIACPPVGLEVGMPTTSPKGTGRQME